VYTLDGLNVAISSSFKEHCIIGFLKGALLCEEQKVLSVPGENMQSSPFFKLTSAREITRLKPIIQAYIEEGDPRREGWIEGGAQEDRRSTYS